MKDDIKKDQRLRENLIRQPIDIRIKTLHINCKCFDAPVDYAHEVCKGYHSLVNDRNDLLHGNVVVDKLQFNDLYFNQRVPVFATYRTMWERTIGVDVSAVGLEQLKTDLRIVEDLIVYVLGCLKPKARQQMEWLMAKRDLGLNTKSGGLGILFPSHLVDVMPAPPRVDRSAPSC
jgi:hypothetical protein